MPERRPILIVDDREESRYVPARILQQEGYSVEQASTGREALEKVLANPALVILDVRLPDILGYEVCQRIKANPQTAHIPVLQVSAAFVSSESRVQALDSGADAYLIQPLVPAVLLATVRQLLRLREAEAISRVSAKQWEVTFDALSEGIALLDADWRVVRCNRTMTQLLEKTYAEIEHQDARTLLLKMWDLDLSHEELSRVSRETENGRRSFSLRIDGVPSGDTFAGGVLVITETTDRKLAETALRMTERLAAMGRLANSIAHEINNPLEAVTNLLYLLQSGNHDRETMDYIAMASSELDRVSRITKQTLAFNRESLEPVETALPELVDGIVTLYSPLFNQQKIRVMRKYESPSSVPGFPGELRQVFSNLVRNAMEALPAGGQLTVHVYPSRDWNCPVQGCAFAFAIPALEYHRRSRKTSSSLSLLRRNSKARGWDYG